VTLPALFSLIFAAALSLLPIFLLIGRRIRQSRPVIRRDGQEGEGTLASDADLATTGEDSGRGTAGNQGTEKSAVGGILERIVRGRPRSPSEASQQESRPSLYPRPGRSPAAAQAAGGSPSMAGYDSDPVAARASVRPEPQRAKTIDQRLQRLTPLQRAIVYQEILGPPVALRDRAASR
jgi:hypothetical protein